MRLSISAGLTPGYTVVTEIIPNLISGLDSFGIELNAKLPDKIMRNINKNETL